jgi:hypothetical protein
LTLLVDHKSHTGKPTSTGILTGLTDLTGENRTTRDGVINRGGMHPEQSLIFFFSSSQRRQSRPKPCATMLSGLTAVSEIDGLPVKKINFGHPGGLGQKVASITSLTDIDTGAHDASTPSPCSPPTLKS